MKIKHIYTNSAQIIQKAKVMKAFLKKMITRMNKIFKSQITKAYSSFQTIFFKIKHREDPPWNNKRNSDMVNKPHVTLGPGQGKYSIITPYFKVCTLFVIQITSHQV